MKIKGMAKGFTVLAAMMIMALFAFPGCIIHEEDCDDDDCYVYTDVVQEVWESFGMNRLYVGDQCNPCAATTGCGFSDYDYSIDGLYFDGSDWALTDLRLDYYLENYGAETTRVWVDLCDDLGCENVAELDLGPGEATWAIVTNPVLDTVLYDYWDCYDAWGSDCLLAYEVEVWAGEEYTCSPVLLDYHYDALYVY